MATDPRNDTDALRQALAGLRKLKAKVAELEADRTAPIAVIGLGCRLPGGVSGPGEFWELLSSGRDSVGRVPASRWDVQRTLGALVSDQGGFLDGVERFDADRFGISHREARAMDPQQRLLLEVSVEALEHAGRLGTVAESQTGVFLGVALTDWEQRTLRNPDPAARDAYSGTGSFNSVAAGRISYALGLRGPNVSLDTACSSSLVAVHLAVQSLRSGECEMALAGGVNLLLSPDASLYFSAMGALSPDGRCMAFDHRANGYVRSEGVGVVVLKRLDRALAEGDRVLAVVAGTAINQDGRSNGLTAPNGAAQREVLRAALEQAGLTPDQVGYVETHGTGTPLGDPIEVEAIRAVYAEGVSEENPLFLGAVKSQIGHTEAAAGVAGFVKAVLALQHREIPGNLHIERLNPKLRLAGTRLRVPTACTPWQEQLAVGVSSFGMSGTNAHLVLTAAPPRESTLQQDGPQVLVLSAGTQAGLRELASRTERALESAPWADAAYTLQVGRESLLERLTLVASDREAARESLRRWLCGEPAAVCTGSAARRAPKLVAVLRGVERGFAGAEREPAFAELWQAACEAVPGLAEAGGEGAIGAARAVALEVAAFAVLRSWGLTPAGYVGVGRGAWSAAVLAGSVPLERALVAIASGQEGALALARASAWLSVARSGGADPLALDAAGWAADQGEQVDLDAAIAAVGAVESERIDGGELLARADGAVALREVVARLHALGVRVGWQALHEPGRLRIELPLTPWAHGSFWLDDPAEAARAVDPAGQDHWEERWAPVDLPVAAVALRWAGPDAWVGLALSAGERVVLDLRRGGSFQDLLTLVERAVGSGAALVLLTEGASDAADPRTAAAWALWRVLAQEAPERWGGAVAAGGLADEALSAALSAGGELAYRQGRWCAPRLVRTQAPADGRLPTDGAWWITGATGAVGSLLAIGLARAGVSRLVLTARRAPSAALVAELEGLGAQVQVVLADVGRRSEVDAARAAIDRPLAGVLHAAGVVEDAPLGGINAAALSRTWSVKVGALEHLAAVTGPEVNLVVVSSASGLLGIRGQAVYAAANAAATALVRGWASSGRSAQAVVFGPWQGGMADEAVLRRLRALGIEALPASVAVQHTIGAIGGAVVDPVIVRFDEARYAERAGGARLAAYLGVAAAAPEPGWPSLRGEARLSHARAVVLEVLAEVLGREGVAGLDPRRGFFDLGLDSMTAVAFSRSLQARLGVELPPTLAFEHSDAEALATWLAEVPAAVERVRVERPVEEAVAIVGMACRFPGGASDPEAFWELLVSGVDAIGEVPAERWRVEDFYDPTPGTPGRTYAQQAAFVEGVEQFDAAFFGISPREAEALDPQQRLLLEVGWEALEHAAIPAEALRRSQTGVFVGIGPSDYGRRFDARFGLATAYSGTGNEASFAAGRLAYALGLNGPAIGLNTACSSSLVTVHLAAQALRLGECSVALAGGVSLMLTPDTTLELSQLQALSPTSRCHTFDAAADGYARGEGCGLIVLKRLSDAQRDGDRVLAVLLGSAVNHDGPSAGLTVPSAQAQQALLRDAVARAGVDPAEIGFLEAHGTGTRLGDPIELSAVKAVYGARPAGDPLVVSSVKTHVGHLELAAGVAGVISAVQSLRHQRFAPHLHLREVNSAIDLDFPVRIPTSAEPWLSERPRRAAVSSFGLSGTNAHVVLGEAPVVVEGEPTPRSHHALVLRATSEAALRGLAGRLAQAVSDGALADLFYTLNTGRAWAPVRAAVVAAGGPEARAKLTALAEGRAPVVRAQAAPVVWLFTGQGSQTPGMGKALYESQPVFREVIDRCEAQLTRLRPGSLREVMFGGSDEVHDTGWAQPALYALQVGLAALWRSWGLLPDAVIGHSIGEVAAAQVAGVLTLEDGLTLVEARGRLMSSLPRDGGMVSVGLGEAEARRWIEGDEVEVAVLNAKDETVLSGDLVALEALVARMEQAGLTVKRLTVSHAFHSPKMSPMLEAFEGVVAGLTLRAPALPLISTLTGRRAGEELCRAAYWRRQVREPVRFAEALAAAPVGAAFVELGPHPVLLGLASKLRPDALFVPSLRRGVADGEAVALAAAGAAAHGLLTDLRGWDAPWRRVKVEAPLTPWVRSRHWVEAQASGSRGALRGAELLYQTRWREVEGALPVGVIGVRGDGAQAWLTALRAAGVHAMEVQTELTGLTRLVELVAPPNEPTGLEALERCLETVRACRLAGVRWTPVTAGVWSGARAAIGLGGLAGLVRAVAEELPEVFGGWVDLDGADQVAVEALGVEAPAVWVGVEGLRAPEIAALPTPGSFETRGCWWITGGTGAVGRAIARGLLAAGAERVVLTARRAPEGRAAAEIEAEPRLELRLGDVGDLGFVQGTIEALGVGLVGVVHAAGALADGALATTSWQAFAAASEAKVRGGWNLHLATADRPIEQLVLISSAAGTLGWFGQGGYGAANAWLDGLARFRRSEGLPGTSVAFGPWAGGGMAEQELRRSMSQVGMEAIAPGVAVDALWRALGAGAADALVVALDWERWVGARPQHRALVAGLVSEVATATSEDRWAGLDAALRQREVHGLVREVVAEVLGHPDGSALDAGAGLFDLGLDSLMATALARALQKRLPVEVPSTLAFDAPSIERLVAWVDDALGARSERVVSRAASEQPIAVIGMACRLPGAPDLDAYWELLAGGRDAVVRVPADRWDAEAWYDPTPGAPGRTYVREGGFLDDVAGFEPGVFGMSPREAIAVDPQQRLLLELAWEALEHAGIAPDGLRERQGAVYVGIGGHDYERVIERAGPGAVDPAYAGTGNDLAFAAGRISYHLGLRGPALSFDTACSSSLVALHLGAGSLRRGEAEIALVGGVRLLLSPESTLQLSALKALSPTARCHTFDAAADGYVRGEGGGMLVLKRLEDARRDGDPVLAVLVGSAVNHDGPSSGLTVPSGAAQRELLATALAESGLAPEEVDVIEAHGTGTSLGDPIEVGAIRAVYGQRPEHLPLRLGSVKSQIGHLELAAGVAGVIKAVLALQQESWPGNLHFHSWNPAIAHDFPVSVATGSSAWPRGRRRAVGVSGFGLAGTNAHALLADPLDVVEADQAAEPAPSWQVLPLSAHSEAGLAAARERLAGWLERHPGASLAEVGRTLRTGRAVQRHRLAVVVDSVSLAVERLRAGGELSGVVSSGAAPPAIAMLFTGQGSQYPGMSRELYKEYQVFREVIDECDAAMRSIRGQGLKAVLFGAAEGSPIHDTGWTQPALYAVEVGLARLWSSWGVAPELLLGHSVGEIAAAHLAGVWSLRDGLRLVEARGRLMQALPRDGAMAAIGAGESQVQAALQRLGADVDVAALNSQDETVVSGDEAGVRELVRRFEADGVRARELTVSHAFHSSKMDPMLDAFEEVVAGVERTLPRLPIVSNLTGQVERERLIEPGYWRAHVRSAVRFAPAVQAAVQSGVRWFVEVGPHPVLSGLGARVVGPSAATFLPSLRRGQPELAVCLGSLARLHVQGRTVDWSRVDGRSGQRVHLPGTVFQRERLWVEGGGAVAPGTQPAPLLTRRWQQVEPERVAGRLRWWWLGAPEVAAQLREAGDEVVELHGELAAAVRTAVVRGGAPDRLGYAPTVGGEGIAAVRAVTEPLLTLWAAARGALDNPPPLWLLTRDGEVAHDALRGFTRTLALEQRSAWGGSVQHDAGAPVEAVVRALRSVGEDELRVSAQGLQALRVEREAHGPSERLTDGVVLITGGLGAVGLAIAERCLRDGAALVVLAGRRAPSADVQARLDGWRSQGWRVEVALGDVREPEQAARLVAHAASLGARLGAIVHAAGVLDDGPASAMDWARVEGVLEVKLSGALALAAAAARLDALVLLSSATSWFGAHGQANYGLANAAIDALAADLRARGLPAVSVAFGPWRGEGMASSHLEGMQRRGIRPLAPAEAVEALARVWRGARAEVAIADADWSRYRESHESGLRRGLLDLLAPASAAQQPQDALEAWPVRSREAQMLTLVVRAVRAVLQLSDQSVVDPGDGFFEIGFDSLVIVQLVERLAREVGAPLQVSDVFERPNAGALAAHLVALRWGAQAELAAPARAVSADEPIAIVGLACRFPGAADADAFWALLAEGRNAVGEAPRARWPELDELFDPAPGTPGKTYTTRGAFLEDIAGFDPGFFGISPREAEAMDPQQRLLLELSWEALEHAQINPAGLVGSATAVYVGMGASEYDGRFQRRLGSVVDAYSGTGNDTSFAAGRVSYTLGLRGPALTVNTACSASLVSLHLACEALRAGVCERALAGGVNLLVSSDSTVRLSQLRALSPSGQCRAFDAASDGYVRGEGGAMFVLERLSDAVAAGRRILAVVRGSAVNHDGASSSLTVPSGPAQTALLREAWARAGVSPEEIGYIEAHGTGTRLGDPIEARALVAALDGRTRPLWVGSVKTNVGHLELAAGAAGLVKAVLALRAGMVPAHLHLHTPNPELPVDSPLVFPSELTPWQGPRIAGVSSFGLSGTNAHVVLEAAPAREPVVVASAPASLLVLSARSPAALAELVGRVADRLDTASLPDVAAVTARARRAGQHRVAVVAGGAAEAAAALRGGAGARGEAPPVAPKVGWVFAGQGVFAPEAEAFVRSQGGALGQGWEEARRALIAAGAPGDLGAAGDAARPLRAGLGLFAWQVAMCRQLTAWGVPMDLAVGHGAGELVAAWAAGVWSLEQAAQICVARARALEAEPERVQSFAVRAGAAEVGAALGGLGQIVAVNGPAETVLTVPMERAAEARQIMEQAGLTHLTVPGDRRSQGVEAAAIAVGEAVRRLTAHAPEVTLVSAADGRALPAERWASAAYWEQQQRGVVQFADAVEACQAEGVELYLELAPRAQLLGVIRRIAGVSARQLIAVSHPERPWEALLEAAGAAWVRGLELDLAAVVPAGQPVEVPGTPFQRKVLWVGEQRPEVRVEVREVQVERPVVEEEAVVVTERGMEEGGSGGGGPAAGAPAWVVGAAGVALGAMLMWGWMLVG